jgi:hypothetical protein
VTSPQAPDFEGARMLRDLLDEVHGLDNLVRVASEVLLACALIIAREVGVPAAHVVLKTAGKALAVLGRRNCNHVGADARRDEREREARAIANA